MPLEMPRQEVLDRKSSSPPTRSLGIETAMELGSHCTGTAHKTNVEVKSSNPDRKRNKVGEIGSAHLDRSVCHLPRSDPGDNDSNMIRPLRSIHGCSPHSHCHSQQSLHNHKTTIHELNESLPIFRMLWFTMFLPLQLFPSSSSTLPGPHSHRREPLVLMHISAQPPLPFSHSFTS